MTELQTTRFGRIRFSKADLLHFPKGLLGFEDSDRWILLADSANSALGWLQSATREELAVAVVSPRRFLPDYRFQIDRRQISVIELDDLDRAFVLIIVSKSNGALTANLKAPVIVNLDRRLGCQAVVTDDHPLRHLLLPPPPPLRKIA